ncbi:VTT domain-containing protein [Cellvibrio polysaccharolyticus]|nr:VTT domain-containing protein [Cellvibrio polysaccharolyticus]
MNPDAGIANNGSAMKGWRIFLFLIVTCAGIFFLIALIGWQPLQWLLSVQSASGYYVTAYPVASALLFVIVYGLALSCGVPGGAVFALLAGFLFGMAQGLLLALCGLACGAVVVRVITLKSGLSIDRKRGSKLADWFAISTEKNPLIFPVLIRMVPVFPFFWLNLVFSLTKQAWGSYLFAALAGALPGVLALVVLGNNMNVWLESEQLSMRLLLSQPLFIASWVILAGLTIVGYCWKRVRLQQAE